MIPLLLQLVNNYSEPNLYLKAKVKIQRKNHLELEVENLSLFSLNTK